MCKNRKEVIVKKTTERVLRPMNMSKLLRKYYKNHLPELLINMIKNVYGSKIQKPN